MAHDLNPKNLHIKGPFFFLFFFAKFLSLPTDLLTYWHTDRGEIIGTLFAYMQGSNNFSWVIGVSRILEFDRQRLSWTCHKHLINLSSHMITTRYMFKFEKSWIWLVEKTLATCKNTAKSNTYFQCSSSQADRKTER